MSSLVLVACVLFILYVYIGYPLALWLLGRSKFDQYPTASYSGDVSIVMIVCNEEGSVEKKIKNLIELNFNGQRKEIIIVDDLSDDRTCEIVQRYSESVQLIRSSERLGKASGINKAMAKVDTPLVMFVDCRQELDVDVITNLTSWFEESAEIGAVSGELMFRLDGGDGFSQGMDGYWKYEKFIRKNEALVSSVPGVTGALYMLRTSAFEAIPEDTLLDDVQIPMVCASKGYRVIYDDRALAWDAPSKSIEKEKQRKIRTLSGNYQLLFRFPKWIVPGGHPIWWQFLSHKIFRLIAPFAAITSLAAAFFLYQSGNILGLVYMTFALSVLLIFPLSLLIPLINNIKLFRLLNSFILLNWFCVLALFEYLFSTQSGSWKK